MAPSGAPDTGPEQPPLLPPCHPDCGPDRHVPNCPTELSRLLDDARAESEALRREQIHAVRLAEAAEALHSAEVVLREHYQESLRDAEARIAEYEEKLTRAEVAEALGEKDAIRRRRAETNAETWRIAQASAAGMLLDVQRDCIAERQLAEAAEARHARESAAHARTTAALFDFVERHDQADLDLRALQDRLEAAEARIAAALAACSDWETGDHWSPEALLRAVRRALTEGTDQ